MALCRGEAGKPDLFITMTCNPNWPEIQEALSPTETWDNRPDLTCRVFKMKLDAMIKDIEDGCFGSDPMAIVASIEFQKRGLPHAHILVCLKDKLTTAAQFDAVVSAQLPPRGVGSAAGILRALVIKHQVHSCGALNPNAPCMANDTPGGKKRKEERNSAGVDQCAKRFPKDYCEATAEQPHDSYPEYERRSPEAGGETAFVVKDGGAWVEATREVRDKTDTSKVKQIDNSWIVPYNPRLTMRYDCHINVEVTAGIDAVKYLYKYVYKGLDRVMMGLQPDNSVAAAAAAKAQATEIRNGAGIASGPPGTGNGGGASVMPDKNDEVGRMESARYITAPEAYWCTMYPTSRFIMKPSVVRMRVHVEGAEEIQLAGEDEAYEAEFDGQHPDSASAGGSAMEADEAQRAAVARGRAQVAAAVAAGPPPTMLTQYFAYCKQHGESDDPGCLQLCYTQFPLHYTYKRPSKGEQLCWVKMKKPKRSWRHADKVTRMYRVSPAAGEAYYLRTLLLSVPGATSFEYLKTVGDEVCETFQMACFRRGLIGGDNDEHWHDSMNESAQSDSPRQMRRHFVMILKHCMPANPRALFDAHHGRMSEDYAHADSKRQYPLGKQHTRDLLVSALHKIMDRIDFTPDGGRGIPERPNDAELDDAVAMAEKEATQASMAEEGKQAEDRLSDSQAACFRSVFEKMDSKAGGCCFINAEGGAGKTTLLNCIIATALGRGQEVVATATTGVAATLLHTGETFHSATRAFCDIPDEPCCFKLERGASYRARRLQEADIIIIDEATMLHKVHLESLDLTLQHLMSSAVPCRTPFGGKLVVLSGDFRQCLPVIQRGLQSDVEDATLLFSRLWPNIDLMHLTGNFRLANADAETLAFKDVLMGIGNGTRPCAPGTNRVDLPPEICLPLHADDVTNNDAADRLIAWVFDGHEAAASAAPAGYDTYHEWLMSRRLMAGHNADVDMLNERAMKLFAGDEVVMKSFDSMEAGEETTRSAVPLEVLHKQKPYGFPPHELTIKLHVPYMLTRNYDVTLGLCNGTIVIPVAATRNHVTVTVPKSNKALGNRQVNIPRIVFVPSDATASCYLRRVQFPLRPALAVTVNKVQGQTVDKAGLYLPCSLFSHGQLYVALSRVRSPQGVRVLLPRGQTSTDNVVFKSVIEKIMPGRRGPGSEGPAAPRAAAIAAQAAAKPVGPVALTAPAKPQAPVAVTAPATARGPAPVMAPARAQPWAQMPGSRQQNQHARPPFHERQKYSRCAQHAVNNIMGSAVTDNAAFIAASIAVAAAEADAMESVVCETGVTAHHHPEYGNSSVATIEAVLNALHGGIKLTALGTGVFSTPEEQMKHTAEQVAQCAASDDALLLNNGGHWFSYIRCDGCWWDMDSLNGDGPRAIPEEARPTLQGDAETNPQAPASAVYHCHYYGGREGGGRLLAQQQHRAPAADWTMAATAAYAVRFSRQARLLRGPAAASAPSLAGRQVPRMSSLDIIRSMGRVVTKDTPMDGWCGYHAAASQLRATKARNCQNMTTDYLLACLEAFASKSLADERGSPSATETGPDCPQHRGRGSSAGSCTALRQATQAMPHAAQLQLQLKDTRALLPKAGQQRLDSDLGACSATAAGTGDEDATAAGCDSQGQHTTPAWASRWAANRCRTIHVRKAILTTQRDLRASLSASSPAQLQPALWMPESMASWIALALNVDVVVVSTGNDTCLLHARPNGQNGISRQLTPGEAASVGRETTTCVLVFSAGNMHWEHAVPIAAPTTHRRSLGPLHNHKTKEFAFTAGESQAQASPRATSALAPSKRKAGVPLPKAAGAAQHPTARPTASALLAPTPIAPCIASLAGKPPCASPPPYRQEAQSHQGTALTGNGAHMAAPPSHIPGVSYDARRSVWTARAPGTAAGCAFLGSFETQAQAADARKAHMLVISDERDQHAMLEAEFEIDAQAMAESGTTAQAEPKAADAHKDFLAEFLHACTVCPSSVMQITKTTTDSDGTKHEHSTCGTCHKNCIKCGYCQEMKPAKNFRRHVRESCTSN